MTTGEILKSTPGLTRDTLYSWEKKGWISFRSVPRGSGSGRDFDDKEVKKIEAIQQRVSQGMRPEAAWRQACEELSIPAVPSSREKANMKPGQPLVWLIEDEASWGEILKCSFEPEVKIETSISIDEAIQRMESSGFDQIGLIILDLHFRSNPSTRPEGLGLLERILSTPSTPPILIVTATNLGRCRSDLDGLGVDLSIGDGSEPEELPSEFQLLLLQKPISVSRLKSYVLKRLGGEDHAI